MRLRKVNPKKILVPSVRVTAVYDSELWEEFRRSIASLGIVEPPVVVEMDSALYLVDGLHRVTEAIQQGTKLLPVVVMEGTLKDVLVQNLALNNIRGKIKATESAAVLRELYQEHDLGVDELAKLSGFSEEKISKLLYLSRADPEVLEALDEGKIVLGHAHALARLSDRDLQKRILSQQLVYHLKVQDLEEHIANVLKEKLAKIESPALQLPTEPPQ
mgnify:FL=1